MTDNDKQIIEALEQAERYIMWNNPDDDGKKVLSLIRAALLQVRFYEQPDFMQSLNVAKKGIWK